MRDLACYAAWTSFPTNPWWPKVGAHSRGRVLPTASSVQTGALRTGPSQGRPRPGPRHSRRYKPPCPPAPCLPPLLTRHLRGCCFSPHQPEVLPCSRAPLTASPLPWAPGMTYVRGHPGHDRDVWVEGTDLVNVPSKTPKWVRHT